MVIVEFVALTCFTVSVAEAGTGMLPLTSAVKVDVPAALLVTVKNA
jgi:hypothetical protein